MMCSIPCPGRIYSSKLAKNICIKYFLLVPRLTLTTLKNIQQLQRLVLKPRLESNHLPQVCRIDPQTVKTYLETEEMEVNVAPGWLCLTILRHGGTPRRGKHPHTGKRRVQQVWAQAQFSVTFRLVLSGDTTKRHLERPWHPPCSVGLSVTWRH